MFLNLGFDKELDAFSSSSLDGQAVVWLSKESRQFYEKEYIITGPEGGFITHDSIYLQWLAGDQSYHYITCCSTNDERLKVWIDDSEAASLDVNQYIFDICISLKSSLPKDTLLIALAGSDKNLHLVSFHREKKLQKLIELPGHEDWIQSLDIITLFSGITFIASGSQDNFIRVWKLSTFDSEQSSRRGRLFTVNKSEFEVELETVLLSHEAWVYSVQLIASSNNQLFLLSASMDKSIILWQQPLENDIWTEMVRVGEVGGSALGFLGALIKPDLNAIVGQGYNGALHVWSCNPTYNVWDPSNGVGGHSDCVNDLCWEPSGNYLLTCSKDQTTRLHGPWIHSNDGDMSWHELARPQIHGYDLNCLCSIDGVTFACGAEEKVVRILGATESFVSSMKNMAGADILTNARNKRELPKWASVPPLGLSNKAIYSDIDMDQHFKSVILTKPPLEETLGQNTLWPEIQKLYGHSYEIAALSCNNRGTILASACRATKSIFATIILWDIRNDFRKISEASFHNLTVTQIRFSPDDNFMLTVSRDRTWCLFRIKYLEEEITIERLTSSQKTGSHNRIIWDASWTPDNHYFLTCSRDKRAIFWILRNESDQIDVEALSSHTSKESILSVDVASCKIRNDYLVALALESGSIDIFTWSLESGWKLKMQINR